MLIVFIILVYRNIIWNSKNCIALKKDLDYIRNIRLEISEYKWKYEENKKMYSKNEELFYKTHNTDILQKILLGVIVTFLFFKLN